MFRIKKPLAAALIAALLVTGCSNAGSLDNTNSLSGTDSSTSVFSGDSSGNTSGSSNSSSDGSASVISSVDSVNTSDMFSNRDKEIGYDESTSVRLTLSGDSISCDSDSVKIDGSTAVISEEGTYILTGILNDGMIVVNADDSAKLQLVLDNASINSSTSAAIYVCEADKVFITLASGSVNTLSNGGEYIAIDDNNIDSVIFSKSDLTINGSGTLNVNAASGHGIVSKDDLAITGGTYIISAADHGLSANDSIRIADGSFTISSGKDGIHAENDDDASLGFVYIANGSLSILAEGDGISAGSYLLADNGEFDITTDNTDSSISTKGLKAAGDLTVNAGTFVIDGLDDALHSNSNLLINGGSFSVKTGDDGFHADASLVINDGSISITESYEGLEGLTITINGGSIALVSSDDGLNAAGGNDSSGFGGFGGFGRDIFSGDSDASIYINGGKISINANGDGMDSNGTLYMSGGEVYVSGAENSGNGAIDYESEGVITGGTLIAAGAAGMAQNMSSSSTQGSILLSFTTQSAGTTISLYDEAGSELISWQSDKTYGCVVISCPELTVGSTYTLKAGDYETTFTMDSLVYGSGTGMSGRGGFGGKHQDGNSGMDDSGRQRPDSSDNFGGQMPGGSDGSDDFGDRMPGGDMTPPESGSEI